MSIYSRIFVFIIFSTLGTSFWITTGLLYWEFSDDWQKPVFEGSLWFDLLTHHSHKFIFFPLFGSIALLAFYLPAVVFVDMYWRPALRPENNIPFARSRFIGNFLLTIVVSVAVAWGLNLGEENAIWQITPQAIQKVDGGSDRDCVETGTNGRCRRVSIPTALANVRRVSQTRERLTDLTRNCKPDPLIEQQTDQQPRRYCFVITKYTPDPAILKNSLTTDERCCTAMAYFERTIKNVYNASPRNRSWLDKWQLVTLSMKIFFLLVILIISVLLAMRRERIMNQYGHLAPRIDRGVLIGTAAMLFLPLMNHAFLRSTELLYGPNNVLATSGDISFYRVPYALSMAFFIWGFVIMLFFVHRRDRMAEHRVKIITTIVSGLFVLNYDTIIDYSVRLMGPGASIREIAALIIVAVLMWLSLIMLKASRTDKRPTDSTLQPPAAMAIDTDTASPIMTRDRPPAPPQP